MFPARRVSPVARLSLRDRILRWARRGGGGWQGVSAPPVLVPMLMAAMLLGTPGLAQTIDCARLQQQLVLANNGGDNGQFAAAARKQAAELQRTGTYAHQLGCDQPGGFFAAAPPQQCAGLNNRIAQMQANLAQLQTAARGNGGHAELVARYNAYCRGGAQAAVQPQQPPRQRNFFESLFGGGQDDTRPPPPPPVADLPGAGMDPDLGPDGGNPAPHGGSQAVCVRTCDGGFFPLPMSSRHSSASLTEMCEALCPGTEVQVYTRNPDHEIKTAVGVNGSPYMDMPNALKFQKSFDPACTCRPAGKTWAQALTNAEAVLGNQRKGDILVTPEKSAEMSRPKLDPKTKSAILNDTAALDGSAARPASVAASPLAPPAKSPASAAATSPQDSPNGDPATGRKIRQVGPQL